MNRRRWLSTVAAAMFGVGCARWSTNPDLNDSAWKLRSPQMSPDSIVLEIALVRLPADSSLRPGTAASSDSGVTDSTASVPIPTLTSTEFWGQVDEQCLPRDVRRILEQNGFRAGLIDGLPTPALQAALDTHDARRQASAEAPENSAPTSLRRIQNRAGRRGKIVVSEVREHLSVLLPEEGRLHGKTYDQAQCVVSVRSFPRGDGRVDLELAPEIEHGQPRQRWLGESTEGSFRIDASRERLEFDCLRITPRLGPGQMIVLGPTAPLKGLGRQFFGETEKQTLEPRVLVVRLAQTQLDDLFAPERNRPPLVTEPDS